MHMVTFNPGTADKFIKDTNKANKDGGIYHLSSLTNNLNQVEQNNKLSRQNHYEASCTSTSHLVNNYEVIQNDSAYTTYSSPNGL